MADPVVLKKLNEAHRKISELPAVEPSCPGQVNFEKHHWQSTGLFLVKIGSRDMSGLGLDRPAVQLEYEPSEKPPEVQSCSLCGLLRMKPA